MYEWFASALSAGQGERLSPEPAGANGWRGRRSSVLSIVKQSTNEREIENEDRDRRSERVGAGLHFATALIPKVKTGQGQVKVMMEQLAASKRWGMDVSA